MEKEIGATVYGNERQCIRDGVDYSEEDIDIPTPIKAVIVSENLGFNSLHITKAINYLRDETIEFYVLDVDMFIDGTVKYQRPSGGSIATMLKAVTGRLV